MSPEPSKSSKLQPANDETLVDIAHRILLYVEVAPKVLALACSGRNIVNTKAQKIIITFFTWVPFLWIFDSAQVILMTQVEKAIPHLWD